MYYYTDPNGSDAPQGPISIEQLQSMRDAGEITDQHLVAKDGDVAWRPLKELTVQMRRPALMKLATLTFASIPTPWKVIGGIAVLILGAAIAALPTKAQQDFDKESLAELNRITDALNSQDYDDAIRRGNALADALNSHGEFEKEADVRRLLSNVINRNSNAGRSSAPATADANQERRASAVLSMLQSIARQAPPPQTTQRFRDLNRDSGTIDHSCQQCDGRGTIKTPSGYITTCPLCGGTGRTTSDKGQEHHYDPLAGY